jgi:membrane-bound lytic murein transglycosylase B
VTGAAQNVGRIGVRKALRTLAFSAALAVACAPASAPPQDAADAPPPEVPAAPAAAPEPAGPTVEGRIASAKGWGWLVDRLAADGVDRGRAERAFADARVATFDGLYFSIEPREPRSMYGGVLRRRSVDQARACVLAHESAFASAEEATGVPAELVASILHIETRCGRNTGNSIVLFGLARLAMANEPANLAANVARRAAKDGSVDPQIVAKVHARAAVLDGLFYPEVRAVFTLADRGNGDPLALRGSRSGAFGYAQFLPTSYLRFGADGNGDGKIDLYQIEDAAASAANYLANHGWQAGLARAERRQVIWHYNRSDAYIDAVLGLSDQLHTTVRRSYAGRRAPVQPATTATTATPGGVTTQAGQ